MGDSPIIEVDRLTHSYGARVALHEATLSVNAGESFALLGPNGSGKTTLFRILSTMIPPQEGRATVLGSDLARDPQSVRPHIGVVFQNPSLDKQLTAEENLRHHGHLYNLRGAELRNRITDLLARVELSDRARERIGTFSGGMRRRVEIAKALLNRPRLLIMDEPSTGLDPIARADVWKYLEEVRQREGVTIVLTTHLMDEADRCDRVAILDRGKLVAADSPAALKEKVGGDVITLTTNNPTGVADAVRAKFSINPEIIGNTVRIERPRGHEFVPALIESLPDLVTSVQVGKPTLEDVFIRTTGRGFAEG